MAALELSFSIDGDKVMSRALDGLAFELANMQGFFERTGKKVQAHSKRMFASQGGAVEKYPKWAGLSGRTEEARKRRWGYYKQPPAGTPGILHWTGKLENTFRQVALPDRVIVDKPVPYAIYHQRGGGNLPQRAVMELDNATIAEVVRDLQTEIREKERAVGL